MFNQHPQNARPGRHHFLCALFRNFRCFDDGSHRARSRHENLKAYDLLGHPVAETRARFLLPTRFGDEVSVETAVVACGRSSFKLEHRLTKGGALAAEGLKRVSGSPGIPPIPKE